MKTSTSLGRGSLTTPYNSHQAEGEMTQKIVGGYSFREQLARIEYATRTTRESLDQIINQAPGTGRTAMLVAKAAMSQIVIHEAINEIEKIAGQKTP